MCDINRTVQINFSISDEHTTSLECLTKHQVFQNFTGHLGGLVKLFNRDLSRTALRNISVGLGILKDSYADTSILLRIKYTFFRKSRGDSIMTNSLDQQIHKNISRLGL